MTNKPEEGKIYALTGGPGDAAISNGNTWAESEVLPVENLAVFTTADAEAVLGRKLRAGEASSIRKSLEGALTEAFVDVLEGDGDADGWHGDSR